MHDTYVIKILSKEERKIMLQLAKVQEFGKVYIRIE